jgi:hypothetical protein
MAAKAHFAGVDTTICSFVVVALCVGERLLNGARYPASGLIVLRAVGPVVAPPGRKEFTTFSMLALRRVFCSLLLWFHRQIAFETFVR